MLQRTYEGLDRVALFAVWVGGAALLCAALMVTVDVLSRRIFGVTMGGSDEISGYVFAASTTWAYAHCVLRRSNVRIDVLYKLFPRLLRSIIDIVAGIALLTYMGILTWHAYGALETSWAFNSRSITTLQTPLWIPQGLWFAGLCLFLFTLTFVLIRAIITLVKGDLAGVQAQMGTQTLQEEIEQETLGMDVARPLNEDRDR